MSGSTARQEITSLSEQPDDIIVTDPKGELLKQDEIVREHGYTIHFGRDESMSYVTVNENALNTGK